MNILEKAISERRRGAEAFEHEDFLQRMLMNDEKACSDEASRLTDAEIKDNILTMIIAGPEKIAIPQMQTTISHLSWFFSFSHRGTPGGC